MASLLGYGVINILEMIFASKNCLDGVQGADEGPVFGQPVAGAEGDHWMAPVEGNAVPLNCPPGLEYLTTIDQLIIKQRLEAL